MNSWQENSIIFTKSLGLGGPKKMLSSICTYHTICHGYLFTIHSKKPHSDTLLPNLGYKQFACVDSICSSFQCA